MFAMTASYWPTLGRYVEGLEQAGKLLRITSPINKDTELHPLVRLQFRGLPESERKAFLFENVVDGSGRRYDMPVVVGAIAASAEIYSRGMRRAVDEIGIGSRPRPWPASLSSAPVITTSWQAGLPTTTGAI